MDDNQPFVMFNALWFKPDGGMALYEKYMAAAAPLLKKYGARPKTGGSPRRAPHRRVRCRSDFLR